MRFTRLAALLALSANVALAQGTQPNATTSSLTLDKAIETALQNNPAYLTTSNTIRTSEAAVHSAWGGLLPGANFQFGSQYQQGGTVNLSGLQLPASGDQLQSYYNLGLSYNLSGTSLFRPKQARANLAAAQANVTGAAESLRSLVTQQYITALGAEASAAVADTLVQSAQATLDLANAKLQVGAGTILDVRTAEVALGQAKVNALTAHNTAEVAKLTLFQDMGVPAQPGTQLVTNFKVQPLGFTLDSLLNLARRVNPQLKASKSTAKAAETGLTAAHTQYLPSLFLQTGWQGYGYHYTDPNFLIARTQGSIEQGLAGCSVTDSIRTRVGMSSLNCAQHYQFTPEMADAIRASNNGSLFHFSRQPLSLSAGLSIPIFNGFQREEQVEVAEVQKDNAEYQVRTQELALRTNVTQAFLNIQTDLQTVALQEQNAQKALEELTFAQEKYKVGTATFVEVTQARGTYTQALSDRVNAIYTYHKDFAALESAVGRPLR
jgi:outer membrane protein